METKPKPMKSKGYRGPPPRKDLVVSPMKVKDWKGNELFRSTDSTEETMTERNIETPPMDIGITPGLMNGDGDYVDPHLKTPRDYESDFVKLSLQGGHKNLLQRGCDEVNGDEERRQKGCENISQYNKIAKQGGHKDILRTDTPTEERPGTAERRLKGCDSEALSSYNKLAKTGGHKDLLRMDVAPEQPKKIKGSGDVSEYNKVALQGGRKDLLRLDVSEPIESVDERKTKKYDNISEYSQVALQGGHKDILKTERPVEPEVHRRQKACDTEQLSKYNKLAKTGGHKNLLKMNVHHDIEGKKGKGCSNVSDYAKMAMQGGHKDLLAIEENKPVKEKVTYERKGGDWFEHNNNVSETNHKNKPQTQARPSSAGRRSVPQNGSRNQSNGILPSGTEHAQKCGKKRFEPTQRSEAPFATNW